MIYAVWVDERDKVWLSDFDSNALVASIPVTSKFTSVRLPSAGAAVRQILGRKGEVWGAESGTDKLVVVVTGEAQSPSRAGLRHAPVVERLVEDRLVDARVARDVS